MEDFAQVLAEARRGDYPQARGVEGGAHGFAAYIAQNAMRHGFELGYEAGQQSRDHEISTRVERAREAGFDAGARTLLNLTLVGLSEVVGELESRRAAKVMLENARKRLGELVDQLGSVAPMVAQSPEIAGLANIVESYKGMAGVGEVARHA